MNLKRTLGLDILDEKYAYATDRVTGYTSAQKIPDRWVSTTCEYCSVGCGMLVGVKEGRAVSVRGNPNHRANLGTLCPKGLSEQLHARVGKPCPLSVLAKERRARPCGLGRSTVYDG